MAVCTNCGTQAHRSQLRTRTPADEDASVWTAWQQRHDVSRARLLELHLKEMLLPTFLREYGNAMGQCATEGVDHPGYLMRLAELELIAHHHRMVGLC